MQDQVDAFANVLAQVRISNVPADDLDVLEARQVFQPTPVVERVIQGERAYPFRLVHGHFRQMRADESIGPCDQNRLAMQVHA